MKKTGLAVFWVSTAVMLWMSAFPAIAQDAPGFDVVIVNGRVMDPKSGLDAVRNVGIRAGKIVALSMDSLAGKRVIDATGLVVAPGFIDLHEHGQQPDNYRFQARDGVTTSLELEIGTADVAGWYQEREGKALINYGVSSGHLPVRMRVMRDPGDILPVGDAAHRGATSAELARIGQQVEMGLKLGALAVGMGINYTAAATRSEVLDMFRISARYGAPVHVHLRYLGVTEPDTGLAALSEVLAAATTTRAPLHVVHVTSMGLQDTPKLLEKIAAARDRGIDVTTECYPYVAASTGLESALFEPGWQSRMGISYGEVQWARTGERLNAATFEKYRKQGGPVVVFMIPEKMARAAIADPMVMIASDGMPFEGRKVHPRGQGTFARVLGHYVREEKVVSLMTALRKMTLMPAERLQERAPAFRDKGRIQVGADADITVFDPESIIDKATFEEPLQYSEGIRYVLVNGIPVVSESEIVKDVLPGRAARAPLQSEFKAVR
jgi:N-acyl-D-aspartate/D-glutamate deacylase